MKLLLLALAVFLPTTIAFAQKKAPDPELRDKRAVAVDAHKSRPSDTTAPRKNSTSRELASIERSSIQKPKTAHNPSPARNRASGTPVPPAEAHKDKPVKFSYRPPDKPSSNTHPAPAPVQAHKKPE